MLNVVNPYIFISQHNSIRFAKQLNWDNTYKPKTIENTLSYQEDGLNQKNYYQLFQNGDSVRTQIKTTYKGIRIEIKGCCNDFSRNIVPIKRSNYLNHYDYRTATAYTEAGKLHLFFKTGYILDEDFNYLEPYNLYQYIPDWLKIGKNIEVEGFGEITIDQIVWNNDEGCYVLKTSQSAAISGTQTVFVTSVYNKFDYEVWEFDMGFGCLDEGKYQILITFTNSGFDTVYYKSEMLHIKQKHENTHLFVYENSKNHQINYSRGIQHMMRLEYEDTLSFSSEGEHIVHKTDENSILLRASTFENYEMALSPLPTGMAEKVTLALTNDILFVDSRAYVTDGKPSYERLGSSNLYDLKQKLILTDREYENRSDDFYKVLCPPDVMLNEGVGFLLIADTGGLIVQ